MLCVTRFSFRLCLFRKIVSTNNQYFLFERNFIQSHLNWSVLNPMGYTFPKEIESCTNIELYHEALFSLRQPHSG